MKIILLSILLLTGCSDFKPGHISDTTKRHEYFVECLDRSSDTINQVKDCDTAAYGMSLN